MIISLEQYYFKVEVPKINIRIKEFKEELGNVGKCVRLSALYDQLFDIEEEIIVRLKRLNELYEKGSRKEILLVSQPLIPLKKKLTKLEAAIEYIVNPHREYRDRITAEMIERAREYPIAELMEFRKGFANCPFHNERTASFHLNRNLNYAHCFGCGHTSDAIDLYQQLNSTNFIETVRALQ